MSSTARGRDLRLLAPAAVAWASAWLAVAAPDVAIASWVPMALAWALALGAFIGVVIVHRTGRAPGVRAVAAAVLVASAAAAVVVHSAHATALVRDASPLAAAAADHATVDVAVELTGTPRAVMASPTMPWLADDGMVRFDARLVAVDGRAASPVSVRVSGAEARGLGFGAIAGFRARVMRAPAAEAEGFVLRPVGDLDVRAPGPLLAWSAALRAGFAEAADRLGGDGGALVPGLAIGDTAAVGAELDASMKASSLSHLTAVSGANCAIVTALAFALAAACGAPRAVRVVVAIAALAGFIVLVTPEASVVRAGAMAIVVLVATASGRPGGGVAALSVAVIALLAVDPWYARDYGFALSVCATAGLLLLAGPIGERLARFVPGPLAVVLAVPIAAQLACQPVLVLLAPSIASYGVVANLLAGPAAPVGTMVGLLGCLLLPVLPSVGFAALQVAWLPATWIAIVAHGIAALPGAQLPWLADAPGAALLAAVTAGALWLVLARRRPVRLVRAVAGCLVLALAIPVGILVGGPAVIRSGAPGNWTIAACDVGQGDAVLIRSAGSTALIDTGPDAQALERCLQLTGVDRIDLLVLTHWDADHVGGSDAVAGRVGTVLHGPLDGERSDRVIEPMAAAGAEFVEATAGRRGRLGDASWELLWPPPGEPPGNDASLVLDLEMPGWRGLFLGDLGEGAQQRMLARTALARYDLVKVAHHGSADQSAQVYSAAAATVGIVGVGADNGYGHPTGHLLDLLASAGTAVVRTDLAGTSLITVVDGEFELWSERRARAPAPRAPGTGGTGTAGGGTARAPSGADRRLDRRR
ncbi:MBL fold metallo-hydrolase [Agromyces sp. CFH 90414]|uniref:MBL fold metallo-hydrolase n=1 Tax=Agromyces agglutinans TaxID=2662258 RepID=A0A6I2FHW8_9MICO|nr:ComEC/Rec2 family competence protein [Agromyces agglutinans]MRG61553.1 MBL fold metallo-hydrolase [Agromyces agglutinans]